MLYIIIFCFVFWICYSILKDFKKGKTQSIKIHISQNELQNTQQEEFDKRRKRFHIRDKRMDRHRRIWSVLFYLSSYNEISKREFPTKRQEQNLINAKKALDENKPTKRDITTAIRFCQIEYVQQRCDHKLTKDEIKQIYTQILAQRS